MSTAEPQSAETIIGNEASDDYMLRPELHGEQLPTEAAPLARLLRSDDVRKVVTRYRRADRNARRYQSIYQTLGRAAIALQAMAALLGALFIISHQVPGALRPDINSVELVLLTIGTFAGGLMRRTNAFQKWNEWRASAEIGRIELFNVVTSGTTNIGAGESPLLPLQLEYFRRYQLQIQSTYYSSKGASHQRAFERQRDLIVIFALITLVLLGISLASLFGQSIVLVPNHLSVFFGVAIATLTAAIGNWSLLSQDENNAKRYHATFANLDAIRRDYLEPARQAASRGDKEGVLSFVAAVNDLVSVEHRQWVLLHELAAQPDTGALSVVRIPKLRRAAHY